MLASKTAMTANRKKKIPATLDNVLDWLPSKLKKWRGKNSLVQEDAAAHLHATLGTYRNWEQGRKPPGTQFALDALLTRLKEPIDESARVNAIKKAGIARKKQNGNRTKAPRNSDAPERG